MTIAQNPFCRLWCLNTVERKQEISIICKESLRPITNMKLIFFVLFLLIISNAQVISNEDEGRSIIQSNQHAHEINGTIYLPFQTSKNLASFTHL